MYEANLRLILDAKNEVAAKRILTRLGAIIDLQIEELKEYHKGGYEAVASLSVEGPTWFETVYQVILSVQQFGRGWVMTDQISEAIDLSSNEFSLSGIKFANLTLVRSNL
jgi:hypothetical protein